MATVTLSLHAKQPKRGMISFDKAYVEMYEYPRGQKAVITYTEDGHTEEIVAGATADALGYRGGGYGTGHRRTSGINEA